MQRSKAAVVDRGFDPDRLTLSTPHPEDNRALRYHVDDLAVRWTDRVSQAVARTPEFVCAARFFEPDLLMMHVENMLHAEVLVISRAYVRRKYLETLGRPGQKPISCHAEIADLVRRYCVNDLAPAHARWQPRRLLRTVAQIRHRTLDTLWRATTPKPPPIIRNAMVAVEVGEGVDPLKKSEAFWLAGKAVDPRQVLFVFERHHKDWLDIEKELASVRRLGAHCIALHPSVSAGGKVPLWFPGAPPSWLAPFHKSLDEIQPSVGLWLSRTLKEFAAGVWRWESFFRHFNVAVYQEFTEQLPDAAARRLAIDRLGGIETGKMRSQFFDRCSAPYYFQHEIAFVWHHNVEDVVLHARGRTRDVVAVGYPWGHLFDTLRAEGNALRQELAAPGIRILGVYDNGAHLNTTIAASHLESFYGYLVDLARRRSDVALLVKSKKPHILRAMPRIREALRDLEAARRCIVLDQQRTSVIPVALAADFVVAIPASTAACEAALGGREVLMYDPGGSVDHPFSGPDKGIMYRDFAQFTFAVEGMIDKPLRAPRNVSPYLNRIDCFLDAGACHRAGAYIASFLEAKERGLDKSAALRAAKDRYRETCGRLSARIPEARSQSPDLSERAG